MPQKKTAIKPSYLQGLSPSDRKLEAEKITLSRVLYRKGLYPTRTIPKSYKWKPSRHVDDLKKKYGFTTHNRTAIHSILGVSPARQDAILAKGRAAYHSSGSRPGQTPSSWAYARLASVLLGRAACKIDLDARTCKRLAGHLKNAPTTRARTRKT